MHVMGKKRGGSAKKRGGGAKPGKQHVEVIARSRPLNRKELAEGCAEYCVTPGPDKGQLATVKLDVEAGEDAPGIPGPAGQTQRYHFNVDRAFYEDEDNSDIYAYLGGRVLDRAFGGYHACLLAYGQTGSGKTHTILGDAADPGIIPRLSEEIFARVAESETKTDVIVEMVEIYGKEERMSDLLSDSRWGSDTVLKLRQQDPTSFYVQGTRTYQPADSAQMDAFVRESSGPGGSKCPSLKRTRNSCAPSLCSMRSCQRRPQPTHAAAVIGGMGLGRQQPATYC